MKKEKTILFSLLLLLPLTFPLETFSQNVLNEFVVEETEGAGFFASVCSPKDGAVVVYTTLPNLGFRLQNANPNRLKQSDYDNIYNRYVLCITPDAGRKYRLDIIAPGFIPATLLLTELRPGTSSFFKVNPKNPVVAAPESEDTPETGVAEQTPGGDEPDEAEVAVAEQPIEQPLEEPAQQSLEKPAEQVSEEQQPAKPAVSQPAAEQQESDTKQQKSQKPRRRMEVRSNWFMKAGLLGVNTSFDDAAANIFSLGLGYEWRLSMRNTFQTGLNVGYVDDAAGYGNNNTAFAGSILSFQVPLLFSRKCALLGNSMWSFSAGVELGVSLYKAEVYSSNYGASFTGYTAGPSVGIGYEWRHFTIGLAARYNLIYIETLVEPSATIGLAIGWKF